MRILGPDMMTNQGDMMVEKAPRIRIAARETTKSKMRETSGTTALPNKVSHHVA